MLINGFDLDALRAAARLKLCAYSWNHLPRRAEPRGYEVDNLALAGWPNVLPNRGALYVHYDAPLDADPPGTAYTAGTAPGPVLGELLRPVVIIKADDLRLHTFAPFLRLIRFMTAHALPVSVGLVTKDIPLLSEAQKGFLTTLDDRQVEIWHHGYDHRRSYSLVPRRPPWFEFKNTPYAYQQEHLARGLELALAELGVPLHTFGAPYNAVDATTRQVLAESTVKVAFFVGGALDNVLTLHRPPQMEVMLRVRTLAAFRDVFDAPHASLEPLTLQVHPSFFIEADWHNFAAVIRYLSETLRYNFMTPIAFYRWLQDVANLRCCKIGETTYRVDLSALRQAHVVTNLGNLRRQPGVDVRWHSETQVDGPPNGGDNLLAAALGHEFIRFPAGPAP